jgi:DNA-binding NtrC family response regulator
MGKMITSASQRTIDLLTSYDWPGNVRELQNVIQRAVILSEGTLAVDETWFDKRSTRREADAETLGRLSGHKEKELIERALTDSRGRVAGPTGAAAKLGIPGINKHRFQTE